MKVLVIDNYDSFTYNLVQYIQEILGQKIAVFRNDKISLDAVDAYDVIILSPGPGVPSEAGIMPSLLLRYAPTKCIMGVCLGHQAIGESFGGEIYNMQDVLHGVETPILVVDNQEVLFQQLPQQFIAGRYHSWVVRKENLPDQLVITAEDERGIIMGIRHKVYDVRGVQFHPESIMTPHGRKMLENYFAYCKQKLSEKELVSN
ncbi:MAG: aminodeoxychorismate/anthranilate synthase component II [Saprospiraceae bacterium]|nr:aminodeoxychorismate/anthranilate synthase component II [Saprospiraceae bacterium]